MRILHDQRVLADRYDHVLIQKALREPGWRNSWRVNLERGRAASRSVPNRFPSPCARHDLRRLSPEAYDRIEAAITQLGSNPRPPDCRKLVVFEDEWKLRVGDYGILYVINETLTLVMVARIADWREAYR